MKNKVIQFQNGAILAKLTRPNYNKEGKFVINGKEFAINNRTAIEVILPSIPKSIKYKSKISKLDHFKDKDDDQKSISVVDYNNERSSLLKLADDDHEFDNLEDEYKYKKFINQWVAVKKDIDVEDNIEFSVFKCFEVPIEYKDHITYLYHHPDFDFSDHYFNLDIKPALVIREAFKKYGVEEVKDCGIWGNDNTQGMKGSIPKDSSWEFSKINTNYIFGSAFAKRFRLSLKYVKIDQAISEIKKFEEAIDKAVKLEANKVNNNKKIDFKTLIIDLQSISNMVAKIESKAKTESEYRLAKKQIKELIDKLNE